MVFAVLLFLIDIFAFRIAPYVGDAALIRSDITRKVIITVYAGSVFAWICLYAMWRLLWNIQKDRVFTSDNIKYLRIISWCCAGEAVIFLVSGIYYLPFIIVAAAAAFMMLIVRIIKNVFQQAGEMKSELDLTI